MWLRGVMDSQARASTFPDGTIAMFFLVFGWFWPGVVVAISYYSERKKRGDDRAP